MQLLLRDDASPDHDCHCEGDEPGGHAYRRRQGNDLEAAWNGRNNETPDRRESTRGRRTEWGFALRWVKTEVWRIESGLE